MTNKTPGKFPRLFSPIQAGRLYLKNRLVAPPMGSGTATPEGYVTEQMKGLYEALAKGGVGAIVVEVATPDFPGGKIAARQISVSDDKYLPGLCELNRVIKKHGPATIFQISHGGISSTRRISGFQPVGPSEVVRPSVRGVGGEVPRELKISEIADQVEKYAQAARRAREAGFDGIEIHAGHIHLVAQFLSGAWNKRRDQYGGSLANRARFLMEIISATRDLVGKDYPLWCRINGEESAVPQGTTLAEAQEFTGILERAGVDVIDVSASGLDVVASRPAYYPLGWAIPLASAIKQVTTRAVMAVGRLTPELGEQLLTDNRADLIAIGRPLRADPEFVNKLARGDVKEIRPCIYCNACGKVFRPTGERPCTVNAAFAREKQYQITPAKEKKRVLVVGGGPAGMEAAMVLSQRGHDVTLCEKAPRLGGQLIIASIPPFKDDISNLLDYLVSQVKKLNIKVDLNTEVSVETVTRLRPDVVVLASGAKPALPPIKGIEADNVVTAWDVLAGRAKVGRKVVVLGGGRVGCETAEVIVEQGKKVVVAEMLDEMAPDMTLLEGKQILLQILAEKGVEMLTGVKGEEVSEAGLAISDATGQRRLLEADTIVLACGSKAENALAESIRALEVRAIGDCVKPRGILEAIDEGATVARSI